MVQPRPLPTLSETHCARLAIPFPCFQKTFSICSRRGPGRKTRHFPPTVADDQLLCNFSQVRNLLHGEWRAEDGIRLSDGTIASRVAPTPRIERRKGGLRSGRVWVLLEVARRGP